MKNTLPITSYDDINIHELLEHQQLVGVLWSIEDVQSVRPDLNDEQAWRVLTEARDWQDRENGFTWSLIEQAADFLYSVPEED